MRIEGQKTGIQPGFTHQINVFVSLHARQVRRVWKRHHLTFVLLDFGKTHRGIGRDAKHQSIQLRFALPVLRKRSEQDARIFLVLRQLKRPGANRVHIHLFRRAGFQHRVGILRRQDRGEIPRQIGDKRRFRMGERKAHGVLIDFINGRDQATELKALEVGIAAVRDVVIGMIYILLAHKRENHVVGVKVARRPEQFITLEFHPFTQMEGINLAVLAHLPTFREARDQFRCTRPEIDQPVIDRHGTGIHAGSRRV